MRSWTERTASGTARGRREDTGGPAGSRERARARTARLGPEFTDRCGARAPRTVRPRRSGALQTSVPACALSSPSPRPSRGPRSAALAPDRGARRAHARARRLRPSSPARRRRPVRHDARASRSPAASRHGRGRLFRRQPDGRLRARRPGPTAYPALLGASCATAGIPVRVVNAGNSGETSAGGTAPRRVGAASDTRPTCSCSRWAPTTACAERTWRPCKPTSPPRSTPSRRPRPTRGSSWPASRRSPTTAPTTPSAFREVFPAVADAARRRARPVPARGVAGVGRLNQADGVHPTAEGQRIIAETVVHGSCVRRRPATPSRPAGGARQRGRGLRSWRGGWCQRGHGSASVPTPGSGTYGSTARSCFSIRNETGRPRYTLAVALDRLIEAEFCRVCVRQGLVCRGEHAGGRVRTHRPRQAEWAARPSPSGARRRARSLDCNARTELQSQTRRRRGTRLTLPRCKSIRRGGPRGRRHCRRTGSGRAGAEARTARSAAGTRDGSAREGKVRPFEALPPNLSSPSSDRSRLVCVQTSLAHLPSRWRRPSASARRALSRSATPSRRAGGARSRGASRR